MSAAEAENSPETAARPGEPGAGTPFKPGQTGNPGGRPKGLARKVREILGDDDGETLARFWAACLSGELLTIVTDPETGARREERTKVGVKDRIAVSQLLAERGWGKPPQFAPIEEADPLALSEAQANEIAAEFDAEVDEVARKRAERERTQALAPPDPE